ncbi:RlpA-like double-psi beta-barrel-protein domain-containing protein-containing protein [Crucibulum laeve]|uniref:RlpA-like double-psi beta-barrel-protein domain-containing protein-containing protein n=1 Tax=Crucibulum laeve TaxID=68775 RepID=A0A5C3MJ16_9AGAR|nr:RlpA-like double-psi beta-barrel-protein domain-containing protein-containing protein [Crucibulum laeve]
MYPTSIPITASVLFYLLCILSLLTFQAYAWIDYPSDGLATMTHYGLPKDFVAACGCTPTSTHYPTAALSQMAYGSARAYGPACGKCFNLTLVNPVTATPPFFPPVTTFIVVKVTDLCPLSGNGWCSATEDKPNAAGAFLNFDLAFPSDAIPADFFPSDEATYGYKDFGVWNITYQTVSCLPNWNGANDAFALGSVDSSGGDSVCCPANPTGNTNDTCPSFSDANGIPPDTTTSPAGKAAAPTTPICILQIILTAVIFTL